MALKRATFYTSSKDERCAETQKFIEDAGVILDVRDLTKQPLNENELAKLIGNLELLHFLNPGAEAFDKLDVDSHLADRTAVIKIMAKDNSIIRRPIIKSTRLITVGHDRRKISEMLQIKPNGQNDDESPRNHHHHREAQAAK
jgi:arsenate reductase-like glutaredoxin family protein